MAGGLFAGLESFGLSGEGMDIFADEKKKAAAAVTKNAAPVVTEKDFLLDKTTKCPLCNTDFKAKVVKGGKAKLEGTDVDLRPRYRELDVNKYDVIMCPNCGYTALSRFFPTLLQSQGKKIAEKISINFKPQFDTPEIYSYEVAIERYKMALFNAVVKGAKASEKAYICLKGSWIARGMAEEAEEGSKEQLKAQVIEEEFQKNAYEGFMAAVSSESFPMCGMDEMTVNYLLAVLAMQTENFDVSQKMIAAILTSQFANSRIKDKARDLKEEVVKKLKEKG